MILVDLLLVTFACIAIDALSDKPKFFVPILDSLQQHVLQTAMDSDDRSPVIYFDDPDNSNIALWTMFFEFNEESRRDSTRHGWRLCPSRKICRLTLENSSAADAVIHYVTPSQHRFPVTKTKPLHQRWLVSSIEGVDWRLLAQNDIANAIDTADSRIDAEISWRRTASIWGYDNAAIIMRDWFDEDTMRSMNQTKSVTPPSSTRFHIWSSYFPHDWVTQREHVLSDLSTIDVRNTNAPLAVFISNCVRCLPLSSHTFTRATHLSFSIPLRLDSYLYCCCLNTLMSHHTEGV